MPSLANHQSSEVTKLLLIGDSGMGKTGALASLATAGYNLRILDLDNGLDILKSFLTDPTSKYFKLDPKAAERVHFKTLTEPMKAVNGRVMPIKATVFQDTTKLLDNWVEGTDGSPDYVNLGKITTWGSKDILVIDSLTRLSGAAMNFHLAMNGKLGGDLTQNEGRRATWQAQILIEKFLEMLYSKAVQCNVIVISHITYVDDKGAVVTDGETGPTTGYPSALGKALSPKIPQYFNSMLLAKTIGTGQGTRHMLYTQSQGVVAAKSSAPLRVKPSYDLSTGLAEYFKAVRGE